MAIPGSRPNKTGDGRGYPRPRPNMNEDRPPTRDEGRNNDAPPYRRPPEYRPPYVPPRPVVAAPTPTPVAATPPAPAQFVLTDDVRELIKLVAESGLSEVMLETSGWKVQIKREKQTVVEYAAAPVAAPAHSPARAGHAAPAGLPHTATAPVEEDNYHKITAPMVGIFYRSPDTKARPFVQEGEMVEKGQTIGIIEAMKIMNEIVSEHSGRCVRLNVENGQPVEYGQTLLLLEPA